MALGLVAVLVAVSETATWRWLSAKTIGCIALGVVAARAVGAERGALDAAARRHADDADPRRVDDQRRRPAARLRDVLVVHPAAAVRRDADRAGYGFGASVTQAGLFLVPSTLAMLVVGSQTGRLERRFGSKPPLLAGGVARLRVVRDARLRPRPRWEIYVAAALLGSGIGLAFAAMANLIIENVGPAQTGVATGMNTVTRTVGGAFGGAAIASVLAGTVGSSGFATARATRLRSPCAPGARRGRARRLLGSRSAGPRRRSSRTRPAISLRPRVTSQPRRRPHAWRVPWLPSEGTAERSAESAAVDEVQDATRLAPASRPSAPTSPGGAPA